MFNFRATILNDPKPDFFRHQPRIFVDYTNLHPDGPELGQMRYYFYLALLVILFTGLYLLKSNSIKHYRFIHNILKLLLLAGVLSLVLIDTSLIVEKVINKLGYHLI